MATEAELLGSVLANPDGDEPRRAYMEWAAAHGDPRADFIRVQLALAEAFRALEPIDRWAPLYKASKAYLANHGALWRQALEPLMVTSTISKPDFRRGFVEDVTMDAATFAREAPCVYALAPIRYLSLQGVTAAPQALASPHLARIRALDLSNRSVDDRVIGVLARSPHARGLTWLDVSNNQIGLPGLEAIAASPYLRGVKFLNFVGNAARNPVEDYGTEGEAIVSTSETALGRELERRHGRLEWLHAPSSFGHAFPPHPDATMPH